MAAKYRKIDPRIWKDERFVSLNSEEKLIAFYVLTGQSNRIGIFNFSPAMAIEDLYSETFGKHSTNVTETFSIGYRNVLDRLKWEYDERFRVVYLPTWWKYNPAENAKHIIGNLKDLDDLPNSPLISSFCSNTKYLKPGVRETFTKTLMDRYPNRIQYLSDSYGIHTPSQEQEQEQEQELKEEPPSASPTSKNPPERKDQNSDLQEAFEVCRRFACPRKYFDPRVMIGKAIKEKFPIAVIKHVLSEFQPRVDSKEFDNPWPYVFKVISAQSAVWHAQGNIHRAEEEAKAFNGFLASEQGRDLCKGLKRIPGTGGADL